MKRMLLRSIVAAKPERQAVYDSLRCHAQLPADLNPCVIWSKAGNCPECNNFKHLSTSLPAYTPTQTYVDRPPIESNLLAHTQSPKMPACYRTMDVLSNREMRRERERESETQTERENGRGIIWVAKTTRQKGRRLANSDTCFRQVASSMHHWTVRRT